jgi:hypothetical protein
MAVPVVVPTAIPTVAPIVAPPAVVATMAVATQQADAHPDITALGPRRRRGVGRAGRAENKGDGKRTDADYPTDCTPHKAVPFDRPTRHSA